MIRLCFLFFFVTFCSCLNAQDASLISRRQHNSPFVLDEKLNGRSGIMILSPLKDLIIDYITIGGNKRECDISKNGSVYQYKIPIDVSQNDGEIEVTMRQKNNSSIQGVIKDKQLVPNKWSVWEVYPYNPYIDRKRNRVDNVCTHDGSILVISSKLELVFNNLSESVMKIEERKEIEPDTIFKYTIFVPKEAINDKRDNLFFTIQSKKGESNEVLFDLIKDEIENKTTYYYGIDPVHIGEITIGNGEANDDETSDVGVLGLEASSSLPNLLPVLSINAGYKWKIGWDLEGGFGLSLSKSDELYVYNYAGDKVEAHDYCKYHIFIRGGYDFLNNNSFFSLEPQFGFAWDCIKGGDNSLNGYNAYSITGGLRLGVKIPVNDYQLVLYATPEIAKVWNDPKSNYETISANLKQFKQTSDSFDFRLQVGIHWRLGRSKK